MCSLFKIDTKGICLLCFNSKNCKFFYTTENGEGGDGTGEFNPAFKMLVRYLNVDVTKLSIFSSTSAQRFSCPLKSVNLGVTLCEDCTHATNDFLELFQAYEGIRIQMDLCVRQMIEFMERGSRDLESIREYERRMNTGDFHDLISTSIAEGLRKETMEKAVRKTASSVPRVPAVPLTNEQTDEIQAPPENHNHGKTEQEQPRRWTIVKTKSLAVDVTEEKGNKSCNADLKPNITPNMNLERRRNTATFRRSSCLDDDDDVQVIHVEPLGSTPMILVQDPDAVPLKCAYCTRQFTQERILITHHYHTHAMSILRDKGLLPPKITEQQLETALEQILAESTNQCPICPNGIFKWKMQVRSHLLQNHIKQIIEKVEKDNPPPPPPETSPKVNSGHHFRRKVNLTCNPCGRKFNKQIAHDMHQYNEHPSTILSDKGFLPSDISEHHLETAVKNIIGRLTRTSMFTCSICKRNKFQRKYHLVGHLFLKHLPQVLQNAKMVKLGKGGGGGASPPVGTRSWKKKKVVQQQESLSEPTLEDWNCVPCGRPFSKKLALENHQFNKHMMLALSENGLSASHSEQQLEAGLANILGKVSGKIFKCPICSKDGFYSRYQLRPHLLKKHLDQIAGKSGGRGRNASGAVSIIKKKYRDSRRAALNSLKCVPCGRNFPTNFQFETHQLQKHMQTVLRDHLPPSVTAEAAMEAIKNIMGKTPRVSRNVHGGSLFQCVWCERKFWHSYKVRIHLFKCHLDQIIHVAKKSEGRPKGSGRTSSSRSTLENELPILVPQGNYATANAEPGPSSQTPDESSITSQSQPKLTCEYCDTDFCNKSYLEAHKWTKHVTSYLSDKGISLPGVTEQEVKQFFKGFLKPNRSKILQCQICKQTGFKLKCRLKVHLFRHHMKQIVKALLNGGKVARVPEKKLPVQPLLKRGQKKKVSFFRSLSRHKCKLCGYLSVSEMGVRQHFVKQHMRAKKPHKCEHCEQRFSMKNNIRRHLIASHPVRYFADRLPPGTRITDQEFNDAVTAIFGGCKKTAKNWGEKLSSTNCLYECPICELRLDESARMKSHIANSHLDKVVEGMDNCGSAQINNNCIDDSIDNPLSETFECDEVDTVEGENESDNLDSVEVDDAVYDEDPLAV